MSNVLVFKEETEKKKVSILSRVLTENAYNPKTFEYDPSFKPWDGVDPRGVHTTAELLQCLAKNPNIELDAKVIFSTKEGGQIKAIDKTRFVESFQKDVGSSLKLKESGDFFGSTDATAGGSTLVGQDFTPLLGGPFYKNLYYYQDYIRMHTEAFFAYHSDPFARAVIQITRDFVLGTGYELQFDIQTTEGKAAKVAWQAFEEANDLQEQIDQFCTELSIYGESMFWELPNNETKITFGLGSKETAPKGLIPRVRLLDPSNMVEIVTYPEDITRKLFYVWLTPTQYQIYTSGVNAGQPNSAPIQPTLKFIYRQIPAEQILHFKVNSVSNEKRGRSDLFPVFNYLKRLRDSIDYTLIGLQKNSAWAIDTSVDGDQTDIDAYVLAQKAIGTIAEAGSEFVHSKAITRNYLGASHTGGHTSDAFQWCLSAIAAGVGIPVSYFGTHLSGGQTRASALVATEPVAKKMEKRREVIKRAIIKLKELCLKRAGLPDVDCNVIFPEIITQDRSQKLQDLLLAQQSRWIKPERAANIAAKELGIQNYDYVTELKDMKGQLPEVPMPLMKPGALSKGGQMKMPDPGTDPGTAGLSGKDKEEIKKNDSTL